MTDIQVFHPRLPKPEAIDPREVVLRFDRLSDTLMVHLYGPGRPAVSDPVGDHLYLLVDPVSEDVLGFQIEEFLLCVVKEHPAFLEVAELAGVPADEVAAIRRSLPREVRQRAAVDAVFSHLAALTYPADEDVGAASAASAAPAS